MGNEGNFDIEQKMRVKFTIPAHPLESGAHLCTGQKHFSPVQTLEPGEKWAMSAEASDHRCTWGAASAAPVRSGQPIWADVGSTELGCTGSSTSVESLPACLAEGAAPLSWSRGWQVLASAGPPGSHFCLRGKEGRSSESCIGHPCSALGRRCT